MTRATHDDTTPAAAATRTPQSEAGFSVTPRRVRLRSKPRRYDEPAHGDTTPAVIATGTRTLQSGNRAGKSGLELRSRQ
ncbi:hypothetical protein ACIHDR_30405 [Nocardia sp. NPDC052278]|uniref:hypothetical protein n=1 Tax=Nocardia sp. NPDC052278 TaxID=3364328 RepID=UPI0037C72235